MKPLIKLGLCGLLAAGLFAEGHPAVHANKSIQTSRYGRRGHSYGGFYGGYYEPFYDYGYSAPAASGGSSASAVYSPAAPVVMTETVHPVIHEYTQQQDYGTEAAQGNQPVLYLIAFRDSTIRAATTYWVADGALHYLDTGHKEKQAPLDSIDRDLSARLNRERHVPFNIQ